MPTPSVRERLDALLRLSQSTRSNDGAHIQAELERRAAALARPVELPSSVETLELLTFGLAGGIYAVETRFVVAVFCLTNLARLPGATAPVYGVVAWQGVLVTILDVRAPLGLDTTSLNNLDRVVLIGRDGPAVGLLVDAVHEIALVPRTSVQRPPEHGADRRPWILGVTADALQLLDGAALLDQFDQANGEQTNDLDHQ